MIVRKYIITAVIAILGGFGSFSALDYQVGNDIAHIISIHHPGMNEDKSCRLIERRNEEHITLDFYMDVQSVICLDGECKIVDVRLYWDRLGVYIKYELAEGVELEKKEGAPFSVVDYEKLQGILLDKNSVFDGVSLGEVVDVKKDNAGLDGISGATVLTDENASVKGAAWTCYTLWHWANGEVEEKVKEITERTINTEELFHFYKEENDDYKSFALKQFLLRKMYDTVTLTLVKDSLSSQNIVPFKSGIRYLKGASEEVFFSTTNTLFVLGNQRQKVLYLNAICEKNQEISEKFITELSGYIPKLKSYQEVNIMVDFLQEKEVSHVKINEVVLPLLKNESFIIARRVFWFLTEQELSEAGREKVDEFKRKHKDSL